jgi:hypothetical protein
LRPEVRLLAALVGALLAVICLQPAVALGASATITGPEEIVFDKSAEACSPDNYPDGKARAFRDATNRLQVILPHPRNRRLIGTNFDDLAPDCTIVRNLNEDPFPGHFDDAGWISSVYTANGTDVWVLLHNEYHAANYPGMCPSGSGTDCQNASISLAKSTNGGESYTNATPPAQYVAGVPYRYTPEVGRAGVFSPSNIVEKDGFFYTMPLISRGTREQRPGACLMRTKDLDDPTSWRAWDGAGFTVRFVNPYLEPGALPSRHVCQPVSFDEIGQIQRSLTYNTYLNKFFLIGTESRFDPARQTFVRGFFYSFSDDLINWSPRQMLNEPPTICGGQPIMAYPAVIDHNSSDRSYANAGQNAFLYYVKFNPTNCQLTLDRDLVRVPIQFTP